MNSIDNLDARRLVAGVLAGHRQDREQLALRAMRIGWLVASSVLDGCEAVDDVAQDTAITVVRDVGGLRDPTALDAWVRRIAVRQALGARRRERLRRALPTRLVSQVDHSFNPLLATEASVALRGRLQRALAALTPRQRLALVLTSVGDMTETQVADAMGCKPKTVSALLSQARRRLEHAGYTRESFGLEGAPA